MLIGDKIYNMANNTTITDLSTEFKQAFNITSSIFLNSGAQKEVFCVERNGAKCILKLFKNFGERDIREIEIYKKFHHLNGIPKIIETKEHDGKIVVFEEYIDGTTLEDACREYKSDSKKISDLIIKNSFAAIISAAVFWVMAQCNLFCTVAKNCLVSGLFIW